MTSATASAQLTSRGSARILSTVEWILNSMQRDSSWVKARIAARILVRRQSGRVSTRDARLAQRLAHDPGVTDRLIDQALASICAGRKGLPYHEILRSTLATSA
jgi:hypothetical protein